MDDVCPWESVPGPSTEHGAADAAPSGGTASADQTRHVWDSGGHATTHAAEAARASRKNSAQLDSCSSSSDVSLAIAEVSERLRKSCSLQHSGSIGRFAVAADERSSQKRIDRACTEGELLGYTIFPFLSECAGTATSGPGTITRNYSTCSASGRIRLSEMSRASLSSCNYPSPQQSFEYSHVVVEKVEERLSLEKIVPEEETPAESVAVKESQPSPK